MFVLCFGDICNNYCNNVNGNSFGVIVKFELVRLLVIVYEKFVVFIE